MNATLDHVVESLRNATEENTRTALLIGAGCSVSGGIPTASGIVEHIARRFPALYAPIEPKTYVKCMEALGPGERRKLIQRYCDDAAVNWAHIGIAQLIKHGYVDRVLTTNFDPLVIKACALVGEFPAVYDIPSSGQVVTTAIYEKAAFYLHGQYTGYIQINTEEEFKDHVDRIAPILCDTAGNRVWIVVGYSGENDPVMEHLVQLKESFEHRLYWVGYLDQEPAKDVRKRLLGSSQHVCWIPGYDADQFFTELTRRLGCFPPEICAKPLSYLRDLLNSIAPFKTQGREAEEGAPIDAFRGAIRLVENAVRQFEAAPSTETSPAATAQFERPEQIQAEIAKASFYLMSKQYDKVIALRDAYDREKDPWLGEILAKAYLEQGTRYEKEARTADNQDTEQLFTSAVECFGAALDVSPNMYEALNNWGNTVSEWAKRKTDKEAKELLDLAEQKYQQALDVTPLPHVVLYNWAKALSEQSQRGTGSEADQLFVRAMEKFAEATKARPDFYLGYYNWAHAIETHARSRPADAARLLDLAAERYEEAVTAKPDYFDALNNWGGVLSTLAKMSCGEKSDAYFALARKKCESALEIRPDSHVALNNLANTYVDQAQMKKDRDARELRAKARERYEEALAIAPHCWQSHYGLANVLVQSAMNAKGKKADELLSLAEEHYDATLKLNAKHEKTLFNWIILLRRMGKDKGPPEAKQLQKKEQKLLQALRNLHSNQT